jgi:hypothetical protein
VSVVINNTKIKAYYIEIFEGFIGPVQLVLSGKAPEEDGKRIYDELKDYRKGDVVLIKDFLKEKYSGMWEIVDMKLSAKTQQAPAIYSFKISFHKR